METKEKVNTDLSLLIDEFAEKRFWLNVNRSKGKNSCWIWLASGTRGYGRFMFRGKRYKAHRFAYELLKGSIPENLFVCHHCDNPKCVNPEHLFLGTPADNARDASLKGLLKNTKNKLSVKEVLRIRKLSKSGVSQDELARRYKCSSSSIRSIIMRKTWASLVEINGQPTFIEQPNNPKHRFKNELLLIHIFLDSLGIPRNIKEKNSSSEPLTLMDRIKIALDK